MNRRILQLLQTSRRSPLIWAMAQRCFLVWVLLLDEVVFEAEGKTHLRLLKLQEGQQKVDF